MSNDKSDHNETLTSVDPSVLSPIAGGSLHTFLDFDVLHHSGSVVNVPGGANVFDDTTQSTWHEGKAVPGLGLYQSKDYGSAKNPAPLPMKPANGDYD
jgi:hypothetical protein